mmetsp:Transcript_96395/g.267787  ORF Transcript_96395/g.267787 Transcript_96395/m.267787 type:complete len:438 (-) Transcript_96395:74-1387(-)
MAGKTTSSKILSKVLFGSTGAVAFGASGYVFRDLADLSQWVLKVDRRDVFWTFQHRHQLAAVTVASLAANTIVAFRTRCVPISLWAAVSACNIGMLFSGYINPMVMMRQRNHNAMYVPASEALGILKREETVIVTRVSNAEPRAFPDSQVLRPHVARVGTLPSGVPVTMTYCGLTHLGMAIETPNHADGKAMELVPLTQLENNLVLLDKATGHLGQQINGMDEECVCQRLGLQSYHMSARRPSSQELEGMEATVVAKEVPTWRMTPGNFVRTYPNGEVFINDYKMFKNLKAPVMSLYDAIIDTIFEISITFQATNPKPVFPTIERPDPRLPAKEQVWAFNIDDDHVAVTENFVRDGPRGVRNMTVGGTSVVAAWDAEAASLGIWRRPSAQHISRSIDVHGRVGGQGKPLERLNTVKAGVYWIVWANFFPQTRINPHE